MNRDRHISSPSPSFDIDLQASPLANSPVPSKIYHKPPLPLRSTVHFSKASGSTILISPKARIPRHQRHRPASHIKRKANSFTQTVHIKRFHQATQTDALKIRPLHPADITVIKKKVNQGTQTPSTAAKSRSNPKWSQGTQTEPPVRSSKVVRKRFRLPKHQILNINIKIDK